MIDPHAHKSTPRLIVAMKPPGTVSLSSRVSSIRLAKYLALSHIDWDFAYLGFLGFFIVTTTYIVNIGAAAIVIAIVGLLLGRRQIRWPLPVRLFLAFWVWTALSTLLSEYSADIEPLLTLGKVLLIYLVAVNILRHPSRLRFFLLIYLTCFALFPVRGTIFNYVFYHNADFGRPAWRDMFGNPNDMAAFTLLALAQAMSFLHKAVPSVIRMGALAACLVFPMVILMTQSRAAFIGLSVFVVLIVFSNRHNCMRTLITFIVIAVIVVAVAPKDVWQRISGLQYATSTETIAQMDTEGSAGQRWEIWQTAFRIINDHLAFGVGIGQYQQANKNYNPSLGRKSVHDTYLEVLSETGVPGFVMFLCLLAASVLHARTARANAYSLRDTEDWQRLKLLEFGLYGYLVAGIWGTYGFLSPFYIYLGVLYAQAEVLNILAVKGLPSAGYSIPVGTRVHRAPKRSARSA